jgi:hypothetical protein
MSSVQVKDFEGGDRGFFLGITLALFWRDWGKTSFRIADNQAETRTGYIPNTSQERYRC